MDWTGRASGLWLWIYAKVLYWGLCWFLNICFLVGIVLWYRGGAEVSSAGVTWTRSQDKESPVWEVSELGLKRDTEAACWGCEFTRRVLMSRADAQVDHSMEGLWGKPETVYQAFWRTHVAQPKPAARLLVGSQGMVWRAGCVASNECQLTSPDGES